AFPLRIGVGEMHADVTQSGSTQHCIGHRVQKNVSVGVPIESKVGRDGHASDGQWAARSDAVDVPAQAGAKLALTHEAVCRSASSERKSRASSISVGRVILIL